MSIGRNDLCPCDSGRTYKKCCLSASEPAADELFWQRMHAALDALLNQYERDAVPKPLPGQTAKTIQDIRERLGL